MTETTELDMDAGELGRRRWLPAGDDGAALAVLQPMPIATTAPFAGKTIVICCDGTSNDPEEMDEGVKSPTNVYRLYLAVTHGNSDEGRQVTWYDAGIGTGTSTPARIASWFSSGFDWIVKFLPGWLANLVPSSVSSVATRLFKAVEAATGIWIEENIEQGYGEIVRRYEPGDRIFIFGFSRGAYTARCIAGVIDRCGLLKAENSRYVADVMKLYRRRKAGAVGPLLRPGLIHDPAQLRVHVLGLWDTVASLGLPLWGWWFRIGAFWRSKTLDSNPAEICEHVYHALSMDERRAQFFPTITTPKRGSPTLLRQIWLRGAHADVGGAYGDRGLGDIGLEWMLQIAQHHGLKLRRDIAEIPFHALNGQPICRAADPGGRLHDQMERQRAWVIFGAWPRWAPVPRPGWSDRFQARVQLVFGAPHDLVYRRAALAAELWRQRPGAQSTPPLIDRLLAQDSMVFLGLGDKLRVEIAAATLWNRTAVVFETAAAYRITYVATANSPADWRDGEKPPCGPRGQESSWRDLRRHPLRRRRRLRPAAWMELVGHIAHPRTWPVAEFGLGKLLQLLFMRDPRPLTMSLMRLGKYLPQPGSSVSVVNLASGGLFYAFANDLWPHYGNNSGAVTLEIERIVDLSADAPYFVVTPRGEVLEHGADSDSDPICDRARNFVVERNRALREHHAGPAAASWPIARYDDLTPVPAPSSVEAGALYPLAGIVFADALGRAPQDLSARFSVPPQVQAVDDALIEWWRDLAEAEDISGKISFRVSTGPRGEGTGIGGFAALVRSYTATMPPALKPLAGLAVILAQVIDVPLAVLNFLPRRHGAKNLTAWAHDWDRDEV